MTILNSSTLRVGAQAVTGAYFQGQSLLGPPAWTPAVLFTDGAVGVWYDPADMSTMFQDAAGTTPVTAAGQPVGLILDKSGNGLHASQASTTKRPIYRQEEGVSSLEFDGTDDCLVTPTANFSTSRRLNIFAGVRRMNTSSGMLFELGVTTSAAGAFSVVAPTSTLANQYKFDFANALPHRRTTNAPAPPSRDVVSVLAHTVAAFEEKIIARLNGALFESTFTSQEPAEFFGNHPIYIGQRGGLSVPFAGHLYSMLVTGADVTSHVADAETWTNARAAGY